MRLIRLAVILSLILVPLVAEAQPAASLPRIGFLAPSSPSDSRVARYLEAFRQGLRELGYVEGQNIAIEFRWAGDQYDRLPGLAAELVRLKVNVIVAGGPPAIQAAQRATDTIPIVMRARDYDPIARGYVAGLAQPGGNITGVVQQRLELTAKQLELLKEALPTVTLVAVLWDESCADQRRAAEAAARPLGVQLQPLELRHPPYEFASAFAAAAQGQAEALLVLNSPLFAMQREHIVDLAAKSRLPTMFGDCLVFGREGSWPTM